MSTHIRLDEMERDYGWKRGLPTRHGSRIATDKEARSSADGRDVRLLCYVDGSGQLMWDVGAHWKSKRPRRQRRILRRDKGELAELLLSPSMRRAFQAANADDGDDSASVVVATGGVFYPGTGDPPPAGLVVALSEQLAAFATLVENHLERPG